MEWPFSGYEFGAHEPIESIVFKQMKMNDLLVEALTRIKNEHYELKGYAERLEQDIEQLKENNMLNLSMINGLHSIINHLEEEKNGLFD